MLPTTLPAWIDYQQTLHTLGIDMTLERCQVVGARLGVLSSHAKTISVAGTNGKGSSIHLLDAILQAAGYHTMRYTSPYLLRYNERITYCGKETDDASLCRAFEAVEAARGDTPLTYFEFGTLAALWLNQQWQPDVLLLEVGMGGRLDAVNIVDADVALITAIDFDHQKWLGDNRDAIGFEKAGIMRHQRPAVCSDLQPPTRLLQHAAELAVPLWVNQHDFAVAVIDSQTWRLQTDIIDLPPLPYPNLLGRFQLDNAAGAIMTLQALANVLPVNHTAIAQGLQQIRIQGRMQIVRGTINRLFDVAHNPQAARSLASVLDNLVAQGRVHAVFSALADKALTDIVEALRASVHTWHIAPLHNTPRAASLPQLETALSNLNVQTYADIVIAYQSAYAQAQEGDWVVVFGSFYTLAVVFEVL